MTHTDRPPAELVAELHELAGSRRKPAITTLDNLLFDTLVHVKDVAVPLGLSAAMPRDAAREGAERVWRMGWPFWARRRLREAYRAARDRAPANVDLVVIGRGAALKAPLGTLIDEMREAFVLIASRGGGR